MPWYKFSANHGPGHQSHTDHYSYSHRKLTKSEKRDYWESYFEGKEWPIGGVEIVKVLPAKVHQDLVESCRSSIKHNTGLLEVLLTGTEHETRHRGYVIKYLQGATEEKPCFFIRSMKTGRVVLSDQSFEYERSAKDAIDLLIKCRRDEARWKVADAKEKAIWAAIHEKNRLEELARKRAKKLEAKNAQPK